MPLSPPADTLAIQRQRRLLGTLAGPAQPGPSGLSGHPTGLCGAGICPHRQAFVAVQDEQDDPDKRQLFCGHNKPARPSVLQAYLQPMECR